jgi:hypothetical protein
MGPKGLSASRPPARVVLKFESRTARRLHGPQRAAAALGWHPAMLARVLKRPEYKQAGEWRIVDPRVWNAAQAGARQAPEACRLTSSVATCPERSHAPVRA